MKKKCVILYFKEKPVAICEIKEVEPVEFYKFQKECATNLENLVKDRKDYDAETQNQINILVKEIKLLKGEDE